MVTEVGWVIGLLRPVLTISEPDWLDALRTRLSPVADGVARRDPEILFDWLVTAFQYQGMSDATTTGYIAQHGLPSWSGVLAELAAGPDCNRLRSHWHFHRCGYTKTAPTCSAPALLISCPLPRHPFRNGRLSQAAYSLFLFIRDVCGGDIVGWIDERLAAADVTGAQDRARMMREAVIAPMRNIVGVSDKVLSMALADLLLAGDPNRERWITTGAGMIAIDTLVHNFFARTGILSRMGADHAYGPACYGPHGCAAVVERISAEIDATAYGSQYPTIFPRFVQHAIWHFCSGNGLDICNGNQIDDRERCGHRQCPVFEACDRVPMSAGMLAAETLQRGIF